MVEGDSNPARWIRQPTAVVLLVVLALGSSAREADALVPSRANVSANDPAARRLYFAMWTFHFRDVGRGLDNNWVVGVSWGRIYGATFINSFGKRAYSIGLQRTVAHWSSRTVSPGLGYRVGLITGYDRRLFPLAGKTPVLPLLQPLVTLDADRLGLELSYVGVIMSGGVNVRW
jgi:hypothetical protein